ncbi:hypothetical protein RDWZM_009723 [Blomia tropicalis]|uniref:N-terminal methionine N(alpha)-acetyltransferase NatC n=1 Tax=Blomia tropicalis TaxID=40697 RepID=A0A9Q0M3E5_BLOTA|nr:hypothetical protein RDWZM_009723 [Blomia tropicalis]
MPNSNRLVKDNDKETSETLEDELETKLNFTEQTTKPNTNVIYFETNDNSVEYVNYQDERQMPDIMRLIQKDLSEPYSIYTYRYFIHNWPQLCFLGVDDGKCIGAIVCKLDFRKNKVLRGYIAMLAVDEKYRKRKIGTNLVLKAINVMIESNADEVVLETEVTNKPALRLYENLGFVRDKRLFRYYLNGVDALRLKLWLKYRILRNKIGTNTNVSNGTNNPSNQIRSSSVQSSSNNQNSNISTVSSYTTNPGTYPSASMGNYTLDSKESVRHAMTAIYNPIYPYCPTTNSTVVPNTNPTFHAFKTPTWPSSHSMSDILSNNVNGTSTSSIPAPTNGGPQFQQTPLNPTDPTHSPLAAAMAAAQSHYMQNLPYVQNYVHTMMHHQAQSSASIPSIVAPHTFP